MDLQHRIILRASVAAVALSGGAFFIAMKLKALGDSTIFSALAAWAPWVALAGMSAGVLTIVTAMWRVWRWERGHGPMCPRCHGPLGSEHSGRYRDYRRCLACGNASASQL